MVVERLPFVKSNAVMSEVIVSMTQGRLGLALVGEAGDLQGIVTDGDLRRALVEKADLTMITAAEVMSNEALTISPHARMSEAEQRMQEAKVQCLIVMNDENHVVGVVQIF